MEDPDKYFTIESTSEGLYKEKGSKFICYLKPIQNVNAFELFLSEVKKSHPKSRHHCYAYKIDPAGLEYRMNDDGEPSGTAGKPIFGQLERNKLCYLGAIVVRYFGGTKLGTSGLIKAYKSVTDEAIKMNTIIEKQSCTELSIEFDYAMMGTLLKSLKKLNTNIVSKNFDENPQLILEVPKSKLEETITLIKGQLLNRSPEDITIEDKIEGVKFIY